MKKTVGLACIYLGLWGFLGFVATIILGFLSCCAGLPEEIFFTALAVFAIVAIGMTCRSVSKQCKCRDEWEA